ncbi:MAG: hypothetical protein WCH74_04400 [Chloroflexota bacterium]
MRIYEGSPRQDFEEVFRSIGAILDKRVLREVLLIEVPDGFVVQGLVTDQELSGARSEILGREQKLTLTFVEDDVVRFMEEGLARRGTAGEAPEWERAGYYERAMRVLGEYLDEQRPRDVFFFEQSGAFVVRILAAAPTGGAHQLIEFTPEDIDDMIARAPSSRIPAAGAGGKGTQG